MILDGECGTFSPKIIDCFEMAKHELFQLCETPGVYEGVSE